VWYSGGRRGVLGGVYCGIIGIDMESRCLACQVDVTVSMSCFIVFPSQMLVIIFSVLL